MVTPSVGGVVLIPFLFSDRSSSKLRPALVLANAGKGDWVLCQITSKSYADSKAIELKDSDFAEGGLKLVSYARPGKLFTTNTSPMKLQAGLIKKETLLAVVIGVIELLRVGL